MFLVGQEDELLEALGRHELQRSVRAQHGQRAERGRGAEMRARSQKLVGHDVPPCSTFTRENRGGTTPRDMPVGLFQGRQVRERSPPVVELETYEESPYDWLSL